mgnify:CR=1 FL=1
MNKHKSQRGFSHTFSEGEYELHTNPMSKEQYLIDWEKQMVRQQQFLKIIALSFHKSLGNSYRNLLQNSESKNGCCHLQQDLRQMILDHESRLALYFELDIAKLLDLTTRDHNLLSVS